MKKYVVLLSLLAIVSKVHCSRPMFVEGRMWKYVYREAVYNSNGQESWNNVDYSLSVCGDTLVNSCNCKKIYCDCRGERQLYGLAYEEDGKAFLCHLNIDEAFYPFVKENQWYELYDFNAKAGSKTTLISNYTICGYGITTIRDSEWNYIDAAITIDNGNMVHHRYIVEGIGCDRGLFDFENIIDNGSASEYLGCYEGNECVFSREDFHNMLPVSTAILPLPQKANWDQPFNEPLLYDLQGRLMDKPKKGVYIKDGKKHVR